MKTERWKAPLKQLKINGFFSGNFLKRFLFFEGFSWNQNSFSKPEENSNKFCTFLPVELFVQTTTTTNQKLNNSPENHVENQNQEVPRDPWSWCSLDIEGNCAFCKIFFFFYFAFVKDKHFFADMFPKGKGGSTSKVPFSFFLVEINNKNPCTNSRRKNSSSSFSSMKRPRK